MQGGLLSENDKSRLLNTIPVPHMTVIKEEEENSVEEGNEESKQGQVINDDNMCEPKYLN